MYGGPWIGRVARHEPEAALFLPAFCITSDARSAGTGPARTKLREPDGALGDYLGETVGISGQYAIAGARSDSIDGKVRQGRELTGYTVLMSRVRRRAIPAFALFLVAAAFAQGPSGRIIGRTLDTADEPIAGVTVSLTRVETGRTYATTSRSDGSFSFAALPIGEYDLRTEASGFAPETANLVLEVGRTLDVWISHHVGVRGAGIFVGETTPLLDLRSAAIGTVVNRERLASLPLNRREFLPLALLTGGALPAAPGSELSTQNESGLSINGGREASNNFLLDGVDNNDLYINRIVVSPPLDSLREYRLHAANYQAEYGRSGGAQINVVSRSGTNQFHGSIYNYLRNDSLDARNFFDPAGEPIPPFRRNQFGVSTGGPIRKSKAFFFGGYEGTRILDAVTRTARVPTASELAGDFTRLGRPITDPFTQAPFPNSRIPASRLDPIAANLGKAWPGPNRPDPAQNLVTTPTGDGLVNQIYGRLDLYQGEKDAWYARYNLSHDRSLDPFGGTDIPGFGSFTLNRGQNFVLGNTHVFGSNLIAEARVGWNRLRREVLHQNVGHDFAAALGVRGLSTDPAFTGFPALNVPGFAGLGDSTALPITRTDSTLHLLHSLTAARGRHTLKTGVEYRQIGVNGIQGLFGRGQFNFLGALTTNPLSDFVLGFPTFTIQTTIDNPFRQRAESWNGYAQDDWRITSNLTLNLGLRYEWNRPAVDADDRFNFFDLDQNQLVRAGGDNRAGYRGDANNFAPRIGLSWSPAGRDLVLRAGYGVFYDVTVLEANSGLYFNPPFFDLRLFFPSQTQLLTLADPFPGSGVTPLASVNAIQPDFRTGYSQHWNAGIEKELPGQIVARASYAASKGTKLLRRRDLNQAPPAPGEVNLRRPRQGFANVVSFESAASSIYHAGVFSLERRFADGPAFSLAYTLSKSIDDVSSFLNSTGDQGFPQNSHNIRAERALSNFDARHRVVFTGSYESPFQHAFARDWRLHGIASFMTGRPVTPALSVDNSNTGNSGSIFGQDRPDAIGDPHSEPASPERFFDPSAFAMPVPMTFGSAGRNVLTGPGLASIDLAAVRSFEIGERLRLELRAEAFNLANRANFDLPQRFWDQPTFGRVTTAGAARQIQLGLRLTY